MVLYIITAFILILIFIGIVIAVFTMHREEKSKSKNNTVRLDMTPDRFNKIVEAIRSGKSDEEIKARLYVDKYDLAIVKSILEQEKNARRDRGN